MPQSYSKKNRATGVCITMNLEQLATDIREFEGVTRKKPIADIVNMFESVRSEYSKSVVDFGDDAAIIDIGGDDYVLFAADGIWGKIINASPWWAGYGSVVVNVNDISAMGGRPVAMVNVLASSNKTACKELLRGITDGVRKFGVPMVGGHVHPDTPYNALSVAIIGTVKKDCVIRSDTANVGDRVIVAYDMDGKVGPNSKYSWDTTTMKEPQDVREKFLIMEAIGQAKIVTAGKDISNPGTIGTLGMLLEVSHLGAVVDVSRIPCPDGVDFTQWMLTYPATGYVLTVPPAHVEECIQMFADVDILAVDAGYITAERKLNITDGKIEVTVFDFTSDTITGIGSG